MNDGPAERLARKRRDEDGLRLLLSFHGEIRASVNQLSALANGDDTQPQETARGLLDFFMGPLVWHDLDEETSLLPRLRRIENKPGDLPEMIDACTHDHESLESYIERLVPHLSAVADGRALPDHGLLLAAARDMHRMLLAHLALEERTVFPLAARLLSPEDRAAIGQEVLDRRSDRKNGVKHVIKL